MVTEDIQLAKYETNRDWYNDLIFDLKKLAFEGIVKTKHAIGKRIIEDELKFGKPEYGSKRIENLAKDLNTSTRELWKCIQFAKTFPRLCDISQNLTWYEITHNLLPEHKKELIETPPLPEGTFNVIYADPLWRYSKKCDKQAYLLEYHPKKLLPNSATVALSGSYSTIIIDTLKSNKV